MSTNLLFLHLYLQVLKTWLLFVIVSLMRMVIDVSTFPNVQIFDNRTVSLVIFQNTYCQMKTKSQLRQQMGLAFDPERMAITHEEIGSLNDRRSNRTKTQTGNDIADKSDINHDRVRRNAVTDSVLNVDREPITSFSDKHMDHRSHDNQDIIVVGDDPTNYKTAKKVRSHSRLKSHKNSNRNKHISNKPYIHEGDAKTKTDLSRRNGRSIPAAFRKLPWKCDMETKWIRMDDGVFPPYLQTGTCTTKTCMYGFFECTPKKYVIKVLKRDTSRCNPIPLINRNTTYEEVWTFTRYHVTVCCECSRINRKSRQGGQRKQKNRGRRRKLKTKIQRHSSQ